MILKLGIPKGSLQEATVEIFRKAGFKISISDRSYYPIIDDPEIECLLLRAQEIARYVELGLLDAGLTGYDWVVENGAEVKEVADLVYSKTGTGKARWVLAVPNDSSIRSVKERELPVHSIFFTWPIAPSTGDLAGCRNSSAVMMSLPMGPLQGFCPSGSESRAICFHGGNFRRLRPGTPRGGNFRSQETILDHFLGIRCYYK